MTQITVTGKTVQDAVDAACAELGVTSDDLVYEVVEEARSGFLGIGSKPAKIKAWQREDEISGKSLLEEMDKPREQAHRQNEGGRDKNDKNRKNNNDRHEGKKERRDNAPKSDKPAEQRESFPFAAADAKPAEQPKAVESVEVEETVELEPEKPEVEIPLEELPASAASAFEYLKGLAKGLGAEKLEYKAVKTERGVKFVIDGDDANIIIGRRGETMDSLQYLCTLVSSRKGDDYCKISLDVAGYRKKREKALQQLAQREAAKVKKTRYSTTLEPMNPYERRIIHSAIQQIEGVVSESVGEEPRRRVVISLESGGKTRREGGRGRYGNNRRDGGKGRGGRDNRRDSRRDSNRTPAVTTPSREPRNEGNGTLYAKIEL